MVSSWHPLLGSEKSFSIRLVFSVDLCKMASKTKGQFVSVGFIPKLDFRNVGSYESTSENIKNISENLNGIGHK